MRLKHMGRRARWWTGGLVLVVAVGGGVAAWRVTHPSTQSAAATSRTVTAQVETLKTTVSTSGTIEPATQSDLSFSSAGTVTSVDVSPGDEVTKGQSLASIDDTSLQNALTLAEANLDAAQTSYDDTISSGGSTTSIAAAKAQVSVAESSVSDAETALDEATLTSPITGLVAEVNVSVGDQVGSSGSSGGSSSGSAAGGSSSSSSSSAAIVVISDSKWIVDASVGSADLSSLKKGLQATITPSGSSDSVYGTVASVGVVASSSSSGSATFPVVITVTGDPDDLYAGSTADVEITVKQVTDAITIPTAAVSTQDGQTVVTQVKDGETVSTPVTVGLVSGTTTQITDGLSEGDEVVIEGFAMMGGSSGSQEGSSGSSDSSGGGFGGLSGGLSGGGMPAGGPGGGQ